MVTKEEREWLGKETPSFTLECTQGKQHELCGLKGKKVWVAFFRSAACPLCNLRIHDIIEHYSQLTGGGELQILAIFQTPVDIMNQYVSNRKPPFALLSDPDGKAYEMYECQVSNTGTCLGLIAAQIRGDFKRARKVGISQVAPIGDTSLANRMPADFLVDEGGLVRDAFYAKRAHEHIPFNRVVAFSRGPGGTDVGV
uniref:Alkyl hydroperoxide reductase subunit C/ Thiol specific antioxidant domain-containing protein n=2 Tax=Hemiselmis andersenii TaxID=464988 RepID=A0A6T8PKN7_HEMAN